ncbi:hypothetical protein QQF64_011900 [Cirrhinus molitorella]|uniref:Uncharacterized protein n=1 Tax=Cirrhinus molitorella TaxID=172907 RepID=A0ABR3LTX5_9TELE
MADDKIHVHTNRTRITCTTDTGQTSGRCYEQITSSEHEGETVTDSGREGKPIQEGVGGLHRECEFVFLCWGHVGVKREREFGEEKKMDGQRPTTGRQDRMLH